MKRNVTLLVLLFNHVISNQTIIDAGYLKTCPRPIPPENALISHLRAPRYPSSNGGHGVRDYQEHDKIYFQCKDGYTQVDQTAIMHITCGANGKWFPLARESGQCTENGLRSRCSRGFFVCNGKCISANKRCDCIQDCEDGSDERSCLKHTRYIMVASQGQHSWGVITSPGLTRKYADNFSCTYYMNTMKKHRIELYFDEFQLPGRVDGKCRDFVTVNGLHWSRGYPGSKLCGEDLKFQTVYSNKTRINIQVELSSLATRLHLKGYSIAWRAVDERSIRNVHSNVDKKVLLTDGSKNEVYTIFTPIAITAFLPILLILSFCLHKKIKSKKRGENALLTETNLQQLARSFRREAPVGNISESCERSSLEPRPCEFAMQLKTPKHNTNTSDEKRYVKSYDIDNSNDDRFNRTKRKHRCKKHHQIYDNSGNFYQQEHNLCRPDYISRYLDYDFDNLYYDEFTRDVESTFGRIHTPNFYKHSCLYWRHDENTSAADDPTSL